MPVDPRLEAIVQKMMDAGESEEDIAAVIQEYPKTQQKIPPSTFANVPNGFWGGVGESITSGDAIGAGLKGAGGFVQGAILDLPASLWGAAKTAAGLASFTNPKRQIETGKELWEGIKGLPGHISETTSRAGSDPVAFGRMMGQLTGQPIATEGLGAVIPKVPGAVKTAGKVAKAPIQAGVRAAGGPVGLVGDAAVVAYPFMPWGTRLKTLAAGYGLKKIGERMRNVGSSSPEAMAREVEQFRGGPKPPPPPPTEPTILPNEPDIWDQLLKEGRGLPDDEAIRQFHGGEKLEPPPPVEPTIMPNEPDIWDQMLQESRPVSDEAALRDFYGGEKLPPAPPVEATINTGSDPFSRAPLPQTLFSESNPIADLHTRNQLSRIGEVSDVPLPPNEGIPGEFGIENPGYDPFPQISRNDETNGILNAIQNVQRERGIDPFVFNSTPATNELLSSAKNVTPNQLVPTEKPLTPFEKYMREKAAQERASTPEVENPTPEVMEPGQEVAADDPEWLAKQKWFEEDAARMRKEWENRPFNQEEANRNAEWSRRQRNAAKWEGRNINDARTPLTPEQQKIARSYKRIEAEKLKFSEWFAEQEALLPEEELFKVPRKIQNAYDAKIGAMFKEHEKLVNQMGGLEPESPPIIDIKK